MFDFSNKSPIKFRTTSLFLIKFSKLDKLRLTLDEPKDYDLISKIFKYMKKDFFTIQDVLNLFLKHKNLLKINNKIIRNEGLLKSKSDEKKNRY